MLSKIVAHGRLVYCSNGAHLRGCYSFPCHEMFKCKHYFCIPMHRFCNGDKDCPDAEDELNCTNLNCSGLLKCSAEHICVHPEYICDDIRHCPISGDDESICDARGSFH